MNSVSDGVIYTTRIVDQPRTFSYEIISGVNIKGPSFGFSLPYIPKLSPHTHESPMITEDPNVIDLSELGKVKSYRREQPYVYVAAGGD